MKKLIALVLLLPLLCVAQIPQPKANTYINDYLQVLTGDQILQLNSRLRRLEDSTTVQVAILLIANLPPNISLEDFTRTVGNSWKVGVNHNGIVYVAVLNEHKQRLEIAERLEGDIPDMIAAQMIDNLRSDLQKQDYYAAIDLLITQIDSRLGVGIDSDESNASLSYNLDSLVNDVQEQGTTSEWQKKEEKFDSYKPYAFAILLASGVVFLVWAYRYRKKYVRENTIDGIYMGVGSTYYASTHPDANIDGSGGGFGGFGGGGGGGFSGGGASGSW